MHTFPSCTGDVICRQVWTAVLEPQYQVSKHPPTALIWPSCQSRHISYSWFFNWHELYGMFLWLTYTTSVQKRALRVFQRSSRVALLKFCFEKSVSSLQISPWMSACVCLQQSRDDLKTSILWSAFWMQMLNAGACISCTCRHILTLRTNVGVFLNQWLVC